MRRWLAMAAAACVLAGCGYADAAAGDAARGAALYESRCGACHSLQADRIGPRHAGVIGRKAGGVVGFDYSPALKASALVWTPALIERWLADPEQLVPGQRMGFSVADAQARADIAAYLAAQSGLSGGANSAHRGP